MEELKEWVKKPCFEFFIINNRKEENKASYYDLPTFRKQMISFDKVKVKIGEEAKKLVDEEKIKQEIENLFAEQRKATDEEERAFNRFALLVEKKDNLKRLLKQNTYYSYNRKKDETPKITIEKKEYNSKLELLEKEFKELFKEYPILKIPRLDFQEINELMSFEDWRLENEEDYEESWGDVDEKEKDFSYDGDFEKFLKVHYDNYVSNFEG